MPRQGETPALGWPNDRLEIRVGLLSQLPDLDPVSGPRWRYGGFDPPSLAC